MSDHLETDIFGLGFIGYTREEGEAMLRGETIAEPSPGWCSCQHRGDKLRVGTCDLCGIRGQPFEVFACSLHGECSLRRKHSKVKACASCHDRA